MVINYSKWDALELSDDSDIEVHPNVDKKSFIRAKQAQIHQERDNRRHQIKTLKYERIINDGLTERIDRLSTALKSHKADVKDGQNADALVFQSMMESAMESGGDDRPPPPPEGVHEHIKDKPSYPQMMASLVDQVKQEVDKKGSEDRLEAFIEGLAEHKARVVGLQGQLIEKLAELEKEDKRHITSDDIHTGFDYSNVKKEQAQAKAASSSSTQPSNSTTELLNPPRPSAQRTDTGQSSGADGDIEEGSAVTDDSMEASALGKQFSQIRIGDFSSCLSFISAHPSILSESETDGLLVEAFNSELDHKPTHAKQCVHQALLLQYCRQLGGRNGVELFFKRITTKDHQASRLFNDDVDSTYARIRTRAAEILKDRAENPENAEGVEQIQLHAVDPGTKISIRIPPPKASEASSSDAAERAAEEAAREIFEAFPPGLQRALESGELDEVNRVLGKMSVEEAEEVVERLGEGGMLSLEEGVIDATTEEGRRRVEEIERGGGGDAQGKGEGEVVGGRSVDEVD